MDEIIAPIEKAVDAVSDATEKVADVATQAPSQAVQDSARSLESVLSGVQVELKRLNDFNERTIHRETEEAAKISEEASEDIPDVEIKNPPREKKRKFGSRKR